VHAFAFVYAHAGPCACLSVRANMRAGGACGAGVRGVLVGVSGLQAEGYSYGFGGFDGLAVE